MHRSGDGDIDDQWSRGTRDITADDRHLREAGQCDHAVDKRVEMGDWPRGRQNEREEGDPRSRAHGGNIAQIDGERLVADVSRARKCQIEVHALDL